MTSRSLRVACLSFAFAFALGGGAAACQANASLHASTSAEAKADDRTTTAPAETAEAAPPAAPPPAPVTATPANVCPLHCYDARGADRVELAGDDLAQTASAIEPALAKMRVCTPPDVWRRHGSPTIHLRVEPDGVVHEVDVDPHHAFEHERSCIDDAARGSAISLALPGKIAVRCAERCGVGRKVKTRR